ncbi:hypothetical protein GH714_018949 [Hevea brasiliensis]|uniref:Bulb-type lectin domain-containing protein n=1 Tax=Hevea brasiliensis TaxID=3981 RepID=A0A6A6M2J7_HEVBR|nr:hypothetical protein GH714_018949 [Hevea brasiliensis]
METNQMEPNFKAALSVEPIDGKYSCSLEVFLGDVKVWNSGHYSPFFTSERCVLELTKQGDLQLKGEKERVGWRTGTSGQGVEILKILGTGNLVLVDALNLTKWQSFNFPTDVMLRGQRLNVATRLTSFPTNSTAFYSLEIQYNKIALYLNSGRWNYSYWEFKPSKNRNITFAELGSKGLALFNDNHHKMAKISLSKRIHHPLGFLALGNKTGNLGLYFYSPDKQSDGFSGAFCGRGEVEMRELYGVSSVLRAAPTKLNISKVACAKFCLQNCKCVAALYSSEELRECHLYGVVMGVKQVERGTRWTYMVKVQKGSYVGHDNSGLKKWVLAMVGLIDSLVILLVFGGFAYYLIRKRRNNTATTADNTT